MEGCFAFTHKTVFTQMLYYHAHSFCSRNRFTGSLLWFRLCPFQIYSL